METNTSYPNTIGALWPERILYKINKKTQEKKVILQRNLRIFKLYDPSAPSSCS